MRLRPIVVTALAVALGLPILACEPEPFTDDPNQPRPEKPETPAAECDTKRVPSDRPNLGDKRYVLIYACVEQAYVPIEVTAYVVDHTTGERVDHHDPIAGREYTLVIGYDRGHDVRMDVELKPSRAGSRQGFLYISDGRGNRKTQKVDGGWRAGPINFQTAR